MYITYLASMFRSIRFGINEAHGRGVAIQLNYFLDNGGVTVASDGTFAVNPARIRQNVIDLTRDIMTLQAVGDYAAATQLICDARRRPPAGPDRARSPEGRPGRHRATFRHRAAAARAGEAMRRRHILGYGVLLLALVRVGRPPASAHRAPRLRSGPARRGNGAPTAAISPAPATRRSIRSTRTTSRTSRSRGDSRPTRSGRGPSSTCQSTPLMVGGVLYSTGGTRRAVVALDAATGEMLWMHSLNEGKRGAAAPRQLSGRGLSYWSDGRDARILYVTPGYQLVALDAKTGAARRRLRQERHRRSEAGLRSATIDPINGAVGLHAAPVDREGRRHHRRGVRDRRATRRARPTIKGYVRGFDVRTGKRLWVFHTIPRPGEVGRRHVGRRFRRRTPGTPASGRR